MKERPIIFSGGDGAGDPGGEEDADEAGERTANIQLKPDKWGLVEDLDESAEFFLTSVGLAEL